MFLTAYCYALDKKIEDWHSKYCIDCLCNTNDAIYYFMDDVFNKLGEKNVELYKDFRTGLIIGSSLAELNLNQIDATNNEVTVFSLGSLLRELQRKYHIKNLSYALSNTCVTGIDELLFAKNLIDNNKIDNCVLLSFDKIGAFINSGLESFKLLSNSNELEPFNENKRGIVLQGAIVLTIFSRSKKTLINNYELSILSTSIINDAYAIASFSNELVGIQKSIEDALSEADLNINDISIIFCSTNGVYENDFKYLQVLESLKYRGCISSVKHLIKHTLAASALLEMVVSYEILTQGLVNEKCCGYRIKKGSVEKYKLKIDKIAGNYMIVGMGFSGVTGAFIYRID